MALAWPSASLSSSWRLRRNCWPSKSATQPLPGSCLEQALAPELASGALRRISQPDGSLRYLTTSVLLGTAYELRADALLIATAASALLTEGAPTLLENERLLAAYANLPAADYEAALLIEGEVLLLRAPGRSVREPGRWPSCCPRLGGAGRRSSVRWAMARSVCGALAMTGCTRSTLRSALAPTTRPASQPSISPPRRWIQ